MDTSCLTVELVESLQFLARRGKPIQQLVASLKTATVPGIVEYGCARYVDAAILPSLPRTVTESSLGRALAEVRSPIGLRTHGHESPPQKSLSTREVEFCSIPSTTELDQSVEWNGFCHRLELRAKETGFTKQAAMNLSSALFEMAENALIHSHATEPPLVGYDVRHNYAMFVVADVGIGVLRSLRTAPLYSGLETDADAIRLALREGVTCRHGESGGTGFNSVFKALAAQWGRLRFRSGGGCVTMDGTDLDADRCFRHYPSNMPGFQVSVSCCRTDVGPQDVFF